MPKIFRFYLTHCVIGFGVAGLFTLGVMYFNVANLWHLISGSDVGFLALILFWVMNGIVFAGVQTGIAIMMMAEKDDDEGPKGGTPVAVGVPVRR